MTIEEKFQEYLLRVPTLRTVLSDDMIKNIFLAGVITQQSLELEARINELKKKNH